MAEHQLHTSADVTVQERMRQVFDLQRRAEEVPVSEYLALARAVA